MKHDLLIAFFLLATLFALVVYVTAPSIYTNTLMLHPSPSDRYPLVTTLFLLALVVFIAVLLVGVRQHWRWLFWLLLIAFGAMILDIPATLLQLAGVVPSLSSVSVQSLSDGRFPSCGDHCCVDALYLSALWSLGTGQEEENTPGRIRLAKQENLRGESQFFLPSLLVHVAINTTNHSSPQKKRLDPKDR